MAGAGVWLGSPRPAPVRIRRLLAGVPVLSIASAAQATDRSFQATSQAIKRLTDASVLKQITVGRRNRAFEAPELIDAFTTLERRLASPTGDTRIAPPSRQVPRRPP